MKRYALLAALSGVLLVLAIHAVHSHRREYKQIQRQYNVLQQAAGLLPVPLGTRSIATGAGRRQELCVTCHLGMVLPRAHTPPFQAHPDVGCTLSIDTQGCTSCHRGNPLALTVDGAHGSTDDPRQVLDLDAGKRRRQRLQPGCAGCHLDRHGGELRYDDQIVPRVARGMELFVRQGCPSCHRIPGLYSFAEHGPRLDRTGALRTRQQILSLVRRPQQRQAASPMPPVRLPEADLQALVLFLQAQIGAEHELASSTSWVLTGAGKRLTFIDDPAATPNAARGALLTRSSGCGGCHRLDGDREGIVDLRFVGWYRSAAELRKLLERPRQQYPGTYMPQMSLTRPALESLVLYLGLQKTPLPTAVEGVWSQICSRCHGSRRDAKVVVLARRPPELSQRRVSFDTFLSVLTQGRPRTAMPPWGRVMSRSFLDALYRELPP